MAECRTHPTDLETALRTTGAIREFTDRPVTRAEIARILDVARFAPSGGNQQPWHVVSVEDPEVRRGLGALTVATAKEYDALGRAGQRPFGLFAVRREPEALALLDAPTGWALAAVIALGEPVHRPTRLRRNPVPEFASVDRFTGPPLTNP